MTSFHNNIPLFDAPSLSDIYMSDVDDDNLSHGSSSAGSSVFPIYSAMPLQNDSFIADMPEQSRSKIQMTQLPSISNAQCSNNLPRRTQMPSHSYRTKKNHHPSPGNDPPGYDRTHPLDMTRFIYTAPYLIKEETPPNAPTIPTTPTKKDLKKSSPPSPKTNQYLQQRRMHLCVIFLTCMFLLLGVSVAVVGHKLFEGEEESTASLEKEGSLAAVPIDLPDNIFRTPTVSPTVIQGEPSILPTTAVPSISLYTMSPTIDLQELATTTRQPIAPPTLQPTLLPTRTPTRPPAPTSQPIRLTPPSSAPTRTPRTFRPTRAPVSSPAPTEPSVVPDKKAKEQKRQK